MTEIRELNEKNFHLRRQVQLLTARFLEDVHGDGFNPKAFDIVPLTVNIRGLDPVFDGYRVAVIADLHLGQWLTPLRLAGVVGMVNDLKPDLIAIPGDLVSYDLERFATPLAENLKALKAKDGVVVVLGNHDHWAGASKVRKILQQAGVTDLANDAVSIKKGKAELWVSGVDSVKVHADHLERCLAEDPSGIHARNPAGARAGFRRHRRGDGQIRPSALRSLTRRAGGASLYGRTHPWELLQEVLLRHLPSEGYGPARQPRAGGECGLAALELPAGDHSHYIAFHLI